MTRAARQTNLRQLESGRTSQGEVLLTRRDSLDQLKLSIDAMNQPPGQVNALPARLRYRLEPRFLACNIAWPSEVELLQPVTTRLRDGDAMRQLQFMRLGALSNVLQRAQARSLRVVAHAVGRQGGGVQSRH